MTAGAERFATRRDTLAFAICLVLALVARALPLDVQDAIAGGVRSTVLAPFLFLQHQAELWQTARMRFAVVVAERDAAARAALDIPALIEENQRLREIAGVGERLTAPYVSAEVLHQASPTGGMVLLLAAGSRQGVRPLSAVVAPGGLLGVVRSVDADRSVAVIFPHPDFRASAMTLDGSVLGVVAPHGASGPNEMMLELSGVPYRDRVPAGTRLYTSGYGGVYPRGIPIGEVVAVAEEQEGWARTYLVRPAVHPASVTHVIILAAAGGDLSGAFEAEQ